MAQETRSQSVRSHGVSPGTATSRVVAVRTFGMALRASAVVLESVQPEYNEPNKQL